METSKTWPRLDPRAGDPRLGNNVKSVPGDSRNGNDLLSRIMAANGGKEDDLKSCHLRLKRIGPK